MDWRRFEPEGDKVILWISFTGGLPRLKFIQLAFWLNTMDFSEMNYLICRNKRKTSYRHFHKWLLQGNVFPSEQNGYPTS